MAEQLRGMTIPQSLTRQLPLHKGAFKGIKKDCFRDAAQKQSAGIRKKEKEERLVPSPFGEVTNNTAIRGVCQWTYRKVLSRRTARV